MKEFVYKVGCTWTYANDPIEIFRFQDVEIQELDAFAYIHLSDSFGAKVCILRQGNKYGIFSADTQNTFSTSTFDPFPYDEVKCCVMYPGKEYGYFAFRIDNKWGILQVVDRVFFKEKGVYDVEYAATNHRIVVPCKYVSLEDAEIQLNESVEWKNPFEEYSLITDIKKRDVKKGTGRDKIRVTFPDGMVIEDSIVWKTLAESIKRIGVEKVAKLKIPGIEKRNILLVDTHPTDDIIYKKSQKKIAPGYYLLTYNNTPQKAIYLERISDELHLNLKIEIVTYQS